MGYHYSGYSAGEDELTDTIPPDVAVTSPEAGVTWEAGQTYDITWTATDDAGIPPNSISSIYYSTDGGATQPVKP
jgi:hypothetical protein